MNGLCKLVSVIFRVDVFKPVPILFLVDGLSKLVPVLFRKESV